MHFSSTFLATALLAADVLAVPTTRTPHEKRSLNNASKWVKRNRVEDHILPMRIGLTQNNLDAGHDFLMDVSDPTSPRYSNWMTAEEVIEFFKPSQSSYDTVHGWLEQMGIAADRISQSTNKQWIQFDAHVSEAEALLDSKFHFFEHADSGKTAVACDEYHLPKHVQEHVDYITPGVKITLTKEKAKRGLSKRKISNPISIIGTIEKSLFGNFEDAFLLTLCDKVVTPPCVAAAYNVTKPTKAAKGNEIGIFEEGDIYDEPSLAEFFTLFAPQIPATEQPILKAIDGAMAPFPLAPTTSNTESNLDFDLAYPLVYPQRAVLFQTDDPFYSGAIPVSPNNSSGFLNTFLDAIDGSYCTYDGGDSSIDPKYPDPVILGYQGQRQCGVYKPTNVISISYGEQEADLPTAYQQRQCREFQKLAMQGTTVFVASGDSGVAARGADAGNADGCLGQGPDAGKVFNPDFPTSCPYLISVGATLLTGDVHKDQEVAVQRFPSGGGFSNIYARPSWQDNAVNTYLTQHTPSYKSYALSGPTNNPTYAQTKGGLYNRNGRSYPDVAALGDNVVVVSDGLPTLVGGTSASSPIVAAIFNRVNEERIAVGKKPVGFIAPTIYAHPEIFNDIVSGNNSGCGTPGFYAAKGWDPVTGLGTPNYPAVLKLFMSLP